MGQVKIPVWECKNMNVYKTILWYHLHVVRMEQAHTVNFFHSVAFIAKIRKNTYYCLAYEKR